MDSLRQIHDLEVGGKSTHDLRCGVRVEIAEGLAKFVVRSVRSLSAADRGVSCGLDAVEERVAALFSYHVPDQVSEKADVLPQRLVARWE